LRIGLIDQISKNPIGAVLEKFGESKI
jgi:hypothetical protein